MEQGRKLAELGEGIVGKVPMSTDGLKATKRLIELGIKTNVISDLQVASGASGGKSGLEGDQSNLQGT
ncbi:transaldolase family protein [Paenibacillus silviterrae]|uniref:transaldolase family protein n=1 Tax=Paenibacillus silviterrae TaxID=3242194 RepID=UPI002542B04F|nr:transaldolase family protein [Paenibacillus chinjuensis]